ncbi:MAG: hypothetical protein NTV73_08835 [Hyphomicrobiales bacterium]|nr:hypothetical protein [Hyphomicrobiales bacterium]
MKRIAIALCLSVISAEAHAINRYNSTSMTCSKVQATIQQEGAAIMRYKSRSGNPLYDRYVKSRQFCPVGQTTRRSSIPTSDKPSCSVSRCQEIEFLDR